jgi:ABC-type phosphate/phosphonate transport system permease subunit
MIAHSVGVIAKLNGEAIETIPGAPLEAVAMTGANRAKIVTYAVLPSALPSLASSHSHEGVRACDPSLTPSPSLVTGAAAP